MIFQKFTDEVVQKIWDKGIIVPGENPALRRKDVCGAWIERNMYGNRDKDNNTGWEIDHVTPESQGGSDNIHNLRPLQWYNNVTKQDHGLTCPVKAQQ